MMIRDPDGKTRASDAETHIKVLLEETPDDPELLDLYGQILDLRRQGQGGLRAIQGGHQECAQPDRFLRASGFCPRRALEKKDEAEKVMREMVDNPVNAKSVDALTKYAYWLREQEKFDEALVQAKRILELAPEDPEGLLVAGCCYLAKGRYKTAERVHESRHQGRQERSSHV